MDVPKIVVFNGVEYWLTGSGRYYLSKSNTNEGRRHAKGLHVAVWEFYSGETVPPGYEVHHKDGNPLNNDFSNLECLPMREHRALSVPKDPESQREHLERIRPLAAEWHSSEEGREWHRQHRAESLGKIEAQPCVCEFCGKEFSAVNYKIARFCSHNCSVRWEYHNKQRIERRVCTVCGIEFDAKITPRRTGAETCSRKCRGILNARRQWAAKGELPNGTVIDKVCAYCGAAFQHTVRSSDRNGRECCSRSCSAKKRWADRNSRTE